MTDANAEDAPVLFRIVPAGYRSVQNEETIVTLKMTTRGRITIPKFVRDKFGMTGGETIHYQEQDDGSYIARLVR